VTELVRAALQSERQQSLKLIDSHVHLDDERLQPNQKEIVTAAREANVVAQIVPAIARRWWPRVKETCSQFKDVFACYGLHPCFMAEHQESDIAELKEWLAREQPVAVGECGLDYFIPEADKAQQKQVFAAQISLAKEFNLPLVIHARKAVDDAIHMIRTEQHHRGMVHGFSGSMQQASQLIDLGFYISLGGAVTYPRAKRLHRLAKELPLGALLLETDAPDQVNARRKGQLNQTAYLLDVWEFICQLRDEDPETIARQTTLNARELFGLEQPEMICT